MKLAQRGPLYPSQSHPTNPPPVEDSGNLGSIQQPVTCEVPPTTQPILTGILCFSVGIVVGVSIMIYLLKRDV